MTARAADDPMSRLSRVALRHPHRVLCVGAVLVLAAATGLPRLELRTDGRALVSADDPVVRVDAEVRATFGIDDPLIVCWTTEHPDGVFHAEMLRRIRALSAALSELDGVGATAVLSLATEHTFRRRPRSFDYRTFLDPMPDTPEAIGRLREDLRRIGLYDGVLVGREGRSTALYVESSNADRRALVQRVRQLVRRFEGPGERLAVLGAPVAESLLGDHILADLGVSSAWLEATGRDPGGVDTARRSWLGRPFGMVPVAMTVMVAIFLVAFRRPATALLPLVEVGACLVIVFGVMGWVGLPITLPTTILPVILIAVGVADEIHIVRSWSETCRRGVGASESAQATLEELGRPVVTTSWTTAAGFLAFAASPLPPVRDLGLSAAFGVLVCMLFSLTVLPALLVVVPIGWWLPRRRSADRDGWQRVSAKLAEVVTAGPRWVLGVTLLALVLASIGVDRVRVQDSWLEGFEPTSPFARATRDLDARFLGSHVLWLTIGAPSERMRGQLSADDLRPDGARLALPASLDPERLRGAHLRLTRDRDRPRADDDAASRLRRAHWYWRSVIDTVVVEGKGHRVVTAPTDGSPETWLRPVADERLHWEIETRPLLRPEVLRRLADMESVVAGLPTVGGVLGPASTLRTMAFLRDPEAEARRLPEQAHQIHHLWTAYGHARGEHRQRQLLTDDGSRAVVSVFLRGANYRATEELMAAIEGWATAHLEPLGLGLRFAGDVAVSQAMIDAVVETQRRSIGLALLLIVGVAGLLGRSLGRGLLCALPPAVAVWLGFAFMGWRGLPLGVATSMFAAVALGIGVDFAIHFLARYDRARQRSSTASSSSAALADAFVATGPAILIDALAVCAGLSVLAWSTVPANAGLGILLGLGVVGCAFATLWIVPAWLLWRDGRTESRRRSC